MELIYAIAEYFNIPNEYVTIEQQQGDVVYFRLSAGAGYSCKTVRGGKYLKKNSIRQA